MSEEGPATTQDQAYRHRIGFGAWTNDMRNVSLPLEQWPAPKFDDQTAEGIVRTLEVIGPAGYGYFDCFGLYATHDYPPDIVSAFSEAHRNRRLDQVLAAATGHQVRMALPLGLMSWGYDRIIREDPEVRGIDHEGNPHPHAMCGAKEKSWVYIEKLIDTMFAQGEFGAVHLESADLGYCDCPRCAGSYGVVGYNAYLNSRAADMIKSKRPGILVYVCPINWKPWGLSQQGMQPKITGEDLDHVMALSRHIDVFMDQGHHGQLLTWEDARRLHCDYGTSGGLWAYHGARQDRLSYFLPYPKRAARYLAEHYDNGTRGCLYYQGPMINPAVEINSAVAGRVMCDVTRDVQDVLAQVIDTYYEPKTPEAGQKLAEVFLAAEEAYFAQWDEARFKQQTHVELPGEFTLGPLFGTSPNPAAFLLEPFLDAKGRTACEAGLKRALTTLQSVQDQFGDTGRITRIHQCLTVMMHLLNTIMLAKD